MFVLSSLFDTYSVTSLSFLATGAMSLTDFAFKKVTKSLIDRGDFGSMRYVLPMYTLYSIGGMMFVFLLRFIALHT